jgi:hypothetical protein
VKIWVSVIVSVNQFENCDETVTLLWGEGEVFILH